MKPRLNVHVAHELFAKVEIAAKRPGRHQGGGGGSGAPRLLLQRVRRPA